MTYYFFLDYGLNPVQYQLQALKHSAIIVGDSESKLRLDAKDPDIMNRALEIERVLITKNPRDFEKLVQEMFHWGTIILYDETNNWDLVAFAKLIAKEAERILASWEEKVKKADFLNDFKKLILFRSTLIAKIKITKDGRVVSY